MTSRLGSRQSKIFENNRSFALRCLSCMPGSFCSALRDGRMARPRWGSSYSSGSSSQAVTWLHNAYVQGHCTEQYLSPNCPTMFSAAMWFMPTGLNVHDMINGCTFNQSTLTPIDFQGPYPSMCPCASMSWPRSLASLPRVPSHQLPWSR